jgi:hypothetical protein
MASAFAWVFVKGGRSRGHPATGLGHLPAARHPARLAFHLIETPAKAFHDLPPFLRRVVDPVCYLG